MATLEDHGRVSCCQHSDTVSEIGGCVTLQVYCFAVRVHLMTFRSNDVDLAQSAASPRLSASGCFQRSGSRGLRWNSLMRRRVSWAVQEKKKIDESARSRASTHARHIHARACFLVHRFLVSSRVNARPQSP